MDFRPFDIKCYDKLHQRFEFLFEPELLNEMCKYGNLRVFKPDDEIIDIGMVISHMPLVISGSIKVMTEDKDGDELLLYYLELGDTCAVTLNCCTKKAKSTIRAVTETDAELLFVPVDKMEEWMIKYKSWRNYVLDSYNVRLNEMVAAIDNIVFNSMEERLTKYINDKAWIAKNATLNLTHQDIAKDLHSSRVVISRLMKKLEKNGVIRQYRNKVVVLAFENVK
jgi:CRP/FNR family transcriptional regulator